MSPLWTRSPLAALALGGILALSGATAYAAEAPLDPAEAGPRLVAEAFGALSRELTRALAAGGPTQAVTVCSEQAPRIAADLGARHGVTFRRATLKPRNPGNAADDRETEILKTFAEDLARGVTPKPVVEKGPEGTTAFFAPIRIALPLCLQCHGSPDTEIAPATRAVLKTLYPEDRATGYRMGDLRGLWHLTFPAPKAAPAN